MRRYGCITVLLFGIAWLLPGQAQDFNAGFYAGVNAAQVDGDFYSGFNHLGLNAGIFVNREIAGDFYGQLDIRYGSRGAYENFGPDDPSVHRTNYHYLEFPLSVHYLFDGTVQIEAGVSPDVIVRYASFDEYGRIPAEVDPGENRRFGLTAFAGAHYWVRTTFGVGIRYAYSVIPFRDPQEWNHPRYRGYFHNVLSLQLTYKFRRP